MIQQFVKSNGKTYLVNCPTDDGVGSGFAIGQLVMKSYTDGFWYVITTSGSIGNVVPFVSQSQLTSFGTSSYFDINSPYQLLGSTDGNAYQVYLDGTAPTTTLAVSQSAYGPAYITSSQGAIIDIAKPNLLLQNITDGNYYVANLVTSLGTTALVVNQNMISQSWVHPIY